MTSRLFIFVGMPHPRTLLGMDKLAGGFGRGKWEIEVWEPRLGWKAKRALARLKKEGASVQVWNFKADAATFPGYLSRLCAIREHVLLAVNIGGEETTLIPACDLSKVRQLFLATHGHRTPRHDWLAEERFLDTLRRATKLQFLN